MDAERFREAYRRLERLEERQNHRIRPREGMSLGGATPRQLEERLKDLAGYTLELEQILRELFLAIAGQPAPPDGSGEAG
ncbi:MAG: hypothetical protein R3325_01605 [Thermoanaerobaculia bacterium]|nr:hypothetical protein [Thermoanaerobaculia bacterium]